MSSHLNEGVSEASEKASRAAPKGLPIFGQLLAMSTAITEQLRVYKGSKVQSLTNTWMQMQSNLESIGMVIKCYKRLGLSDDLYRKMILSNMEQSLFLEIFAHYPTKQPTPALTKELVRGVEDAVDELLQEDSARLRMNLEGFWDLWLGARAEVDEKAVQIRDDYELFFWGNSVQADLKRGLGAGQFRPKHLPSVDAASIRSGLASEPPLEENFESQSAWNLVESIRWLASEWAQPVAEKTGLNAPEEGSVLSRPVGGSGIEELVPSNINATLLAHHLPRLNVKDSTMPAALQSLQKASQLYAAEAVKRAEEDWYEARRIAIASRALSELERVLSDRLSQCDSNTVASEGRSTMGAGDAADR